MFSFPRLMRSAIAGVCAFASILAAPWPHESEAANVISLIGNGFNFASDEDREYLIDRINTGIKGQIDVGDSLRGSFNINTLNFSGANLGGATPNNEWTGVYQFLVTKKTALGGGVFLFEFGPDPAFAASLCGGVASCTATQPAMAAIVPGPGAMIVMFEDTNHDYAADFDDPAAGALALLNDDGTPHVAPHPGSGPGHTPPSFADVSTGPYVTEEAFLQRAANGTRFWTLGYTNGVPDGPGSATPGPGEGFTGLSTGGDNIIAAFSFTAGTGFVLNNGGLNRIGNAIPEIGDAVPLGTVVSVFSSTTGNVLCNPPAIPCGKAQFAFTGSTRGVLDLDTAFEASSNIDASFFVASPPGTNDSQIPGSVLVFPKFIAGTVNVGTASQPLAAPKTSFEISVTCPNDLPRCAVGSRVKLMAHWVCPGSQDATLKFICQEADFILDTTVKGTVWFSPEPGNTFALSPVPGTANNPTPNVPAPPCPLGYLIVWVVSPDDIDNPRAISFNGLIGNAVIREANASAGAYNAIPIQSVKPSCVTGTGGNGQPACVPTILDTTDPDRTLVFDGTTEYAMVPGKVVGTVRLDRDFAAGDGRTTPPTFRIDSFLTLLTLDVNSNRPNLPVFVDLDFFNEVETLRSTFTEFICWTEKSLSRPDPTRQGVTTPPCGPNSCINSQLRENRFPGKKVLLESGQAVKQQFIGVSDPDCPKTAQFPGFPIGTCPVTLLGIIETKERGNTGANAPYVREYSYNLFNNGFGIPTKFHPN